jgi:hypothetical protein
VRKTYLPRLYSARGFAYFGSGGSPGNAIKINLATFTRADALILADAEYGVSSAVIDIANGYAYFGTKNIGRVIRVDINPAHPFARQGSINLQPGEEDPISAVIEPTHNFAYFGLNSNPGVVVKIDIRPLGRTFSRFDGIPLDGSEEISHFIYHRYHERVCLLWHRNRTRYHY